MMVIGTFLPECLHSLVAALKFDGINPVPDMTKRKTASKLITRGSWPPTSKSILNLSSTRSTTSLKELSLSPHLCDAYACGNEKSHIFFAHFSVYYRKPVYYTRGACIILL